MNFQCSTRPEPILAPFDLQQHGAYERWRDTKLANYPTATDQLIVEVDDPLNLTRSEHDKLVEICRKTNMVIYASRSKMPRREDMLQIAAMFGLDHFDKHLCADDDGVSALCNDPDKQKQEYIPYTNKPINWHTDGYYNQASQQIRAMILHCAQQAQQGGANKLYDHELLYIRLREQNPQYIQALMQPDAMTIPANIQNGKQIRPTLSGPVFSIHPATGDLHCRYTARTRSIEWKKDDHISEAVSALEQVLNNDSDYQFGISMQAGQGMLTNNVLHSRTGFEDGNGSEQRLVYRIRSYDRIHGTSINCLDCKYLAAAQ